MPNLTDVEDANRFFVRQGYLTRAHPEYFEDVGANGLVHQPDVYAFAEHLGRRLGIRHVVDLGCGRAEKLIRLHPEFELTGLDIGSNIEFCRRTYPFGRWIDWNLESTEPVPLDRQQIQDSLILCADVIEHLVDPRGLLATIRRLLEHAPVALISTPERELLHGADHLGPPPNPAHVREWSLEEFRHLLDWAEISPTFIGLTVNNNRDLSKCRVLAVIEGRRPVMPGAAPTGFRVAAIMTVFNEQDIIVPSITYLVDQGIDVYVVDNWSTDRTHELVTQMSGRLIGAERFPSTGPTGTYDWYNLLLRVEAVATNLRASWCIHHDADERRRAPWAAVRLRDALYHVDRSGFTAVDHTLVEFSPIDDSYVPGTDFEAHFLHFRFGERPGTLKMINAWKNMGKPVSLSASGGHEAVFPGRRLYPYNFLLKHYPIRSQAHGEKKVLRERQPRWNPTERAMGWHVHYDHIQPGFHFCRDPRTLLVFDEKSFYRDYLVERLSRVGIRRQ